MPKRCKADARVFTFVASLMVAAMLGGIGVVCGALADGLRLHAQDSSPEAGGHGSNGEGGAQSAVSDDGTGSNADADAEAKPASAESKGDAQPDGARADTEAQAPTQEWPHPAINQLKSDDEHSALARLGLKLIDDIGLRREAVRVELEAAFISVIEVDGFYEQGDLWDELEERPAPLLYDALSQAGVAPDKIAPARSLSHYDFGETLNFIGDLPLRSPTYIDEGATHELKSVHVALKGVLHFNDNTLHFECRRALNKPVTRDTSVLHKFYEQELYISDIINCGGCIVSFDLQSEDGKPISLFPGEIATELSYAGDPVTARFTKFEPSLQSKIKYAADWSDPEEGQWAKAQRWLVRCDVEWGPILSSCSDIPGRHYVVVPREREFVRLSARAVMGVGGAHEEQALEFEEGREVSFSTRVKDWPLGKVTLSGGGFLELSSELAFDDPEARARYAAAVAELNSDPASPSRDKLADSRNPKRSSQTAPYTSAIFAFDSMLGWVGDEIALMPGELVMLWLPAQRYSVSGSWHFQSRLATQTSEFQFNAGSQNILINQGETSAFMLTLTHTPIAEQPRRLSVFPPEQLGEKRYLVASIRGDASSGDAPAFAQSQESWAEELMKRDYSIGFGDILVSPHFWQAHMLGEPRAPKAGETIDLVVLSTHWAPASTSVIVGEDTTRVVLLRARSDALSTLLDAERRSNPVQVIVDVPAWDAESIPAPNVSIALSGVEHGAVASQRIRLQASRDGWRTISLQS